MQKPRGALFMIGEGQKYRAWAMAGDQVLIEQAGLSSRIELADSQWKQHVPSGIPRTSGEFDKCCAAAIKAGLDQARRSPRRAA